MSLNVGVDLHVLQAAHHVKTCETLLGERGCSQTFDIYVEVLQCEHHPQSHGELQLTKLVMKKSSTMK